MLIVGISGKAHSGKDTAADFLVKNSGFTKVALADAIKRAAAVAYPKMTREHFWGTSEMRNTPIKYYPRVHGPWITTKIGSQPRDDESRCACCNTEFRTSQGTQCFLTARYALQTLGSEWGRNCYPNTWVDLVIEAAHCLLEKSGILRSVHYSYTPWDGLITSNVPIGPKPRGVVVSDVRWPAGNEGQAIKAIGGVLIKMMRGTGLAGGPGAHESEQNMDVPEGTFGHIIYNNDMTLEALESHLIEVANEHLGVEE